MTDSIANFERADAVVTSASVAIPAPLSIKREAARRGLFSKEDLRADLESLISGHTSQYYRLEAISGHLHFLVDAQVLLPLISWLARFAKLPCRVSFIAPRKPIVTPDQASIAALSDFDILSIGNLVFLDAAMTLHIFNKTADPNVCQSRLSGAPMRLVNLAALREPYIGYCLGDPACVISRDPITAPTFEPTEPDQILEDLGPIDVVYTWVDSDDPVWQAKFAKHVGEKTQTTHASEARYQSRDELRFSLRSVLKHAPWVRNIYIVTDDQQPDWLQETDRVKVVSHKKIFPKQSELSVFNSHAIESCLHRIPGISERFVYFNDDTFLGRDVTPYDFFGDNGSVKVFFSAHLTSNPELLALRTLPTDAAFRNTIRLIEGRFGMTPMAKVLHTPHPMRKSVMAMIEKEHPKEIAQTRAARIRSDTDLNMTGNLAYYYCVGLGLAAWPKRGAGFYTYIDTGLAAQMKKLPELVRQPSKFFCLNLTFHVEVAPKVQEKMLADALGRLFPDPAEHEIFD